MWGKYNYLYRLLSCHSHWSWKNHPKSWKPQQNLGLFSPNKWVNNLKKSRHQPQQQMIQGISGTAHLQPHPPLGKASGEFIPPRLVWRSHILSTVSCFVSPSHLASCKHHESTKHEKKVPTVSQCRNLCVFGREFLFTKKNSVPGCSEEAWLLFKGKKTRRGLLKSRAGADLPSGKLR